MQNVPVAAVILAVAIDTPLRRLFDYRASQPVSPGHRVWVPFGRRRVVGVVVEVRQQSDVPAAKLRNIQSLIDDEPTFESSFLDLLRWSADYYRHPVGEVIAAALPVALRRGAALSVKEIRWRLTPAGRDRALIELPVRATQMRAASEILMARVDVGPQVFIDAGISRDVLRQLEKRGYVESLSRSPVSMPGSPIIVRAGPSLNNAQDTAVERVRASLGSFTTWLLHGVTGSGKTEVYLRAIAAVARARPAGIGARARDRADAAARSRVSATASMHRWRVLHSGLNDGERLAAWRNAREGAARIVIGTRSAVFVPLATSGLIVVDEEHDASFKQQEGFRYSARDLASCARSALAFRSCSARRRRRWKAWPARSASRNPAVICRSAQPMRTPAALSLIDLREHARRRRASRRRPCWPCGAISTRATRCCCS